MNTTLFLKSVAAATVLAGASLSASATTTALGAITAGATPTQFSGGSLPGPFTDIFTFILPANSGSGYTVSNLPLTFGTFTVNGFLTTFSLVSNLDGFLYNGDDSPVKTVTINGAQTISFDVAAVPAGSYYLSVSGIATGSLGGAYSGAIGVSPAAPVPEPETYAMLLAGLGVMGAIARRRKV